METLISLKISSVLGLAHTNKHYDLAIEHVNGHFKEGLKNVGGRRHERDITVIKIIY